MKYGKRSIWKSNVSSPIAVVVLAILLFILFRATINIFHKAQTSSIKLEQAEANLVKLTDRQSDLTAKVGLLSTDQGIEAEIRTRYHAVKEGELVAVIIDDSNTANASSASSSSAVSTQSASSSPSFWQRVLHVFGL